MLISDRLISERCTGNNPMIQPFTRCQINKVNDNKIVSYGMSSSGYDIRLGGDMKYFPPSSSKVIDPKNFAPSLLKNLELRGEGNYFVLPPRSSCLGVSMERITMPNDLMALCIGKSTYARCGLVVNTTPIEAGWEGHITLELINSTATNMKVYAYEGIAQLVFFQCEPCEVTYADRGGKYQNQKASVQFALV